MADLTAYVMADLTAYVMADLTAYVLSQSASCIIAPRQDNSAGLDIFTPCLASEHTALNRTNK